MSADRWIILAVLAHGFLTFAILCWLGRKRLPLVSQGKIKVKDVALSRDPWPDDARKASNSFDNQFQLPMLAYAGSAIAIYLGAGWLEALLVCVFVLSRVVHALIHCTSNQVYYRFSAYVTGLGLLVVLYADLIIRLVAGS